MAKPDSVPPMEYRFLGRSGLKVSCISLRGWLTYGGHVDAEGSFACMKAAYDCGVNLFDCAEVYANGESEIVMGQAIKKFGGKRNDLGISTKLSVKRPLAQAHHRGRRRLPCALGLDYVDLIFAHRPDRQTPMEETVRAFNHIISTGKALYWGTSQWRADEIAQAWRVADRLGLIGPLMEQSSYNMLEREKVESEFTLLYREPGLGLTVFSPLRMGILTGKYQNGIPDDSRLAQAGDKFTTAFWSHHSKAEWDAIITAVGKLRPIAERLGIEMATLALAWVLKNPNVSSAVTGASSPAQIYDNVRAIGAVEKLTPDMMAEIDRVLDNKPPTILERLPAGQK
ncbi:hypothetical protein NHJ13734_006132 [Beauveria thailandica]